jgi:tetratricopeptide (TPR) repeat protein
MASHFLCALMLLAAVSPDLKRGLELHASGQPQLAAEAFRKALKADPNLAEARDMLALSLAESGDCKPAAADLPKAADRLRARNLKRAAQLAGLRCAMTTNASVEALGYLQKLSRDFPDDPEVLYIKTHAYTDLSIRSSQELLQRAPGSYQTHLLNAESLEVQGNWQDAAAAYRKVIEMNPQVRGIHYRLGRLLLSAPKTETSTDEAKREFEAELRVNPNFAAAEFILGELALRSSQFDEAIKRFTRAAQLEPGFGEAHFGLGRALQEAEKYQEALPPLEKAAQLQPGNPEVHFRLATVYRLLGRTADAAREAELHKQLSARDNEARKQLKEKLVGLPQPPR